MMLEILNQGSKPTVMFKPAFEPSNQRSQAEEAFFKRTYRKMRSMRFRDSLNVEKTTLLHIQWDLTA